MIPSNQSRPSKQSKSSVGSPRVPPNAVITNIDDLPTALLLEILRHLPWESIVRSRYVSKRWLTLMSNSYRILKEQEQRPSLMISAHQEQLLTISQSNPKVFEIKTRNLSLSFLQEEGNPMFVTIVGTHNDLILCRTTLYDVNGRGHYFICNPYTKQRVDLPAPPYSRSTARWGFICEPYLKYGGGSGTIQFNYEYRCKVVRIPNFIMTFGLKFKLEIFSIESGKWRKSDLVVSCPRMIEFHDMSDRLVAHNGILYWLHGKSGFLIGFDLLSNDDTKCHCRFIEFNDPFNNQLGTANSRPWLGVNQRRLWMCRLISRNIVYVWVLKEKHNNQEWCLIHNIALNEMTSASKSRVIVEGLKSARKGQIRVLGLDPNNEDVLYLDFTGYFLICNIRTQEIWKPDKMSVHGRGRRGLAYWTSLEIFPFMFPWQPTPVPKELI